jgi:hypothetical protein
LKVKGHEFLVERSRFYGILLTVLVAFGIVGCSLPGVERAASLDEDTLNRLRLSMSPTLQMQPGETREFLLGVVECCYVFEPVEARAIWSVEPTIGATIDPQSGAFSVDPTTPSGSVFTVSADVENGRRVVSIEVHVFTPAQNPLVGNWMEEVRFACGSGEEVIPEERIGELSFRADGSFSVTWQPFEIYRDYWGTYSYDLARGTLDLVVAGGNYVPKDIDGGGQFSLDDEGQLILSDLWLGSHRGGEIFAGCGHRFVR